MARITPQNAREMAQRSHTARRQRQLAILNPSLPAQPIEPFAADSPEQRLTYAREYQVHLCRLRSQLAKETEPQKIERLCAAIARLEDVHCRYLGIPLPGSRKLSVEKPIRRPMLLAEPT